MPRTGQQNLATPTITAAGASEPEHPPTLSTEELRSSPSALRLRISGTNRVVSVPRLFAGTPRIRNGEH